MTDPVVRPSYGQIKTIDVPHSIIDLADRRTVAIIRAAVSFPDALRQIARSCYVQGLEDGAQIRETNG